MSEHLNLGCGMRPIEHAVNHDRWKHSPHVDVAFDLNWQPWPHDGSYRLITAYDVLEHLNDVLGAVNECWRLLQSGGVLIARLPAYDNPITWSDLTHLHPVGPQAFDIFDRRLDRGGHYGPVYLDKLGRQLLPWKLDGVDRVNPDPRWPELGDWQFTMVKI